MKKQIFTLSAAVMLLSAAVSCKQQSTEISSKATLNNELDTVSYILGLNLGSQLAQDFSEINLQPFMSGVKKALESDSAWGFTREQCTNIFRSYLTKKVEKIAAANIKAADDFLAENKTKEGVVTTASGLQYKVITPGDGKQFPAAEDQVECLYRGTLLNGNQFDGTDLRGNQPARFRVDGVIKGWTEMLQLMSLGEKVQVWIHPSLGYGAMDNGAIEPNSLLIFEMELVQIIKPEPENQNNGKKKTK